MPTGSGKEDALEHAIGLSFPSQTSKCIQVVLVPNLVLPLLLPSTPRTMTSAMLAIQRTMTTVPLCSAPLSITADGPGPRLTLTSGPVRPLIADAIRLVPAQVLLPLLLALSTLPTTTSAMLARRSQTTIAPR